MTFHNETIMITGGTGSFGQYMTKWLLKNTDVPRILVFSRDEEKQLDMRREINDPRVDYVIGDVRDYPRVLDVIDTAEITMVFHAAALKIIDTGEKYPLEVIKTNIQGTANVARACSVCEVKKAVLISTDKAVKPINLYGMTKGIAEKIWLTQKSFCLFSVARYGNVIGSRGSVIPYFRQLANEGKPFPITHPGMTRFMLTLDHAINAAVLATTEAGGIIVPRIPAANIMDIAEAVGGKTEVVGIRPGEKIHECLINEDEFRSTEMIGPDYFLITGNSLQEHYQSPLPLKEFTSENAPRLSVNQIKEMIKHG